MPKPRRRCIYPGSNPTREPLQRELEGLLANAKKCASIYLDTVQSMSKFLLHQENHAQGLARTHKLSDGSIYYFLSYSTIGEQGTLSQYRYSGPTDDAHVLQTHPLTVAPMKQLLTIDDQHPSDICFLADVDRLDAGYLFVTEEYDKHRLSVYRWEPSADLTLIGSITHGFPHEGPTGPQFVFVDRVDDFYYLGIASSNWGWGQLLRAACGALFPTCKKGEMDLSAFKPVSANSILPASAESRFPFQVVGSPCQVKLIKDSTGQWYLLAFRSDPPDSETGTDYVDAYAIQFSPFAIFGLVFSTHIVFPSGDTSFASTGTHYVEDTGRLLVSSSYRWSEDEGPGNSGYVSRVDECPSS
jgi:hypothetical protein